MCLLPLYTPRALRVRPPACVCDQYLPAMWYHKVEQRGLTIAVNWCVCVCVYVHGLCVVRPWLHVDAWSDPCDISVWLRALLLRRWHDMTFDRAYVMNRLAADIAPVLTATSHLVHV